MNEIFLLTIRFKYAFKILKGSFAKEIVIVQRTGTAEGIYYVKTI